ncbi:MULTISPECIES: MFS transporter [unclassified Streptomyces]|uniref:MFS transporter n=1 Tax=Streptomyces TaxID=1883 RepID=UPI0001C1B138|nr:MULTISPECIES: MFS transporter [unclassified Streptomyces]AEN08917.1 major facilitator superfamily MFS_1 [Streptomyces sp. SirexAA-E]MYR69087.1 MFS transporter [Streptomyces sp. SID4939]MYS03043.1 MFS transporter [Streptomyces sp. SID4940]MYT63997.1 MFS transporter [Streptomyces sp. SID8357]MYT89271.1 MFS transporter [Streptomyces sp. SID8360]MYU31943.1 MFS transporter [Streptomyces sp. SID8358]MYW36404.1 MFS transporter [Streptomyces sp. SID1]
MPSAYSAASASGRSVPTSLWRDGDFRRFWVGQTASQLGEHTSLVVLPLFAVLTLGAGAGELGVLRAVGQAPILLLSLFAGAWVDRWRARTVMVLTDAGRALALGAAAVAGLCGVLGLPALFVVAFAVGALSVFFDVAYQAFLVRLVRRDQLVRGNSALEGSRSAAQIGGPALGGALVSVLSAPVAAASGALFFALSFLSIRRIGRRESVPERSSSPPRVWRRIHEGLRFVVGDPSLRTVCLASAAFQLFFAAAMTAYLLLLPRDLHLSGTAVGLALAATGPGALLGSLLAARLPSRFGHGAVLVSAAALGDGVFLCVPALPGSSVVTFPALLAVNLVFGAFSQLVNVTLMAVRQAVTPDGMQGRAAATINFVGMGLTPLGSLLGGFLAQGWGTRTGLLVAAAGMLLSPVVMALSPLARLGRTLPAPPGSAAPPA